ncbi:MAG: C69 family dipeptidase [Candidatus Bathyarchaeia archaeon]
MCDILVATPETTKNGCMIFAKNSDRDPNEAQILEYLPRMEHTEDKVRLTYVDFPQVKRTYAIAISRPWWIWGAEMGVNEFGLAIGNTAVFTREPRQKTGILGMDLIRLALERTVTSKEALDFIISVIKEFGQGGSGSYEHEQIYHNSFVICDPNEAYVLETAGKYWAWKRIRGVYSISNALTIENDWDSSSKNLVEHAVEMEWCKSEGDFNFAKCYSDRFYTYFAHGKERRAYTLKELKDKEGEITLEDIIRILRSHENSPYRPERGSMRDVCMHYGGLTRPSQTASSQISMLFGKKHIHWFTGVSNPCLSIFKPFHFDAGLPDLGEKPTNKYSSKSYWWRIERFHRRFQTCYRVYIAEYSRERDALQDKIIMEANRLINSGELKTLYRLTESAFKEEENLANKWDEKIKLGKLPIIYGYNWKRVNNRAGINIP